MGTISGWLHAICFGLFMGSCWWICDMGKKPYPDLRKSLPSLLLCGFSFGLFDSFGWQALRFPIICVTAPAVVSGFFLSWASRPKRSVKSESAE
jgi:hypothetical protein